VARTGTQMVAAELQRRRYKNRGRRRRKQYGRVAGEGNDYTFKN